MENPYAAGELTPELVQEERRRPRLWRSMLLAYGVHHVMSLVGLLAGMIVRPTQGDVIFPRDTPVELLQTLVLIPLLDLYLIVEPLLALLAPNSFTAVPWWWLRALVVLTIPIVVFVYGATRKRWCLWYIAIVSFSAFVTLVLTRFGPG